MCYTCAGLTPPFAKIYLPPCGMKNAETLQRQYTHDGVVPVVVEDASLSCCQYRLVAERGGGWTGYILPKIETLPAATAPQFTTDRVAYPFGTIFVTPDLPAGTAELRGANGSVVRVVNIKTD